MQMIIHHFIAMKPSLFLEFAISFYEVDGVGSFPKNLKCMFKKLNKLMIQNSKDKRDQDEMIRV